MSDTRGIARKYGTGLKLTGGVLTVDLSTVTASVGNVLLPNSGAVAALTNAGAQRSLLKLDTSNRLILGDSLGDILVGAGASSNFIVYVNEAERFRVGADSITVTTSNNVGAAFKLVFNTTERFRFSGDGGMVIGSSVVGTVLGAAGIGLDNNLSIYHRYSTNWISSMKLGTSGELILGATGNTQLDLVCGDSGAGTKTIRFYRGATKIVEADNASSADESALQILINTIGFRRVKVGSSDGIVPGTARVLYIEA